MSFGTDDATGGLAREHAPPRITAWTGWRAAVALAAAWFLLTLPLLGRSEWEDDMETLNVATALESRWSGNYFVPTLQGEPRLNKPPLLPWLTALTISPRTAADLDHPNERTRWAALWRLAFESRLPTHVMAALLILTVYGLGRSTCSPRCGLIAAAVCATMLLFTRYGRFASFDVPLALFAAAAQLFLAEWVFHNRRWTGAIGAGLALGLGMLSKGPIVLLFTVVPVLAYLPLRRRLDAGRPGWHGQAYSLARGLSVPATGNGVPLPMPPKRTQTGAAGPIITLILLAIAPVLPWALAVGASVPGAASRWYAEVTRRGATAAPSGKWFTYIVLLRLALPWTAWIIAGAVLAWRDFRRRDDARGAVLVLLWVVLPLVILSLARDRKPHYLLPLVAPLAVLAARGLDHHRREYPRWDTEAVVVVFAHWLALFGFAAAVLLSSDVPGARITPSSLKPAAPWLAAIAILIAGGAWMHRRRRFSIVVATVLAVALLRGVEGARPPVVPEERVTLRTVARHVWQTAPPEARLFIHDTSGQRPLAVQPAAELELLLGRPIRWTPDPGALPPGPGAMALVQIRRAVTTTQPTDLPDWSSVGQWPIGKIVYEVLVPESQRRAFVSATPSPLAASPGPLAN